VKPEDARVLLFDGGTAPLTAFGGKLSRKAADSLRALGVELHMGAIVTNVNGAGLDVRDHDSKQSHYDAATVLWTAGIEAPPFAAAVAQATGAERDHAGRIVVQDDLTIPGHPEVSVAGDVMSLRRLPGVAEVAMQAGHYAGKRIRNRLAGQPAGKPFRYHDLGSAAYISRGRAVVSAGPVRASGFPGWLIWLFVHIAFLTGFRNRLGAILTWWVAFTRDVRRERAYTTSQVGWMPNVYEPDARSSAPASLQPPHQRSPADTPADAPAGSRPRE
jgi:NADH:ubiquinone reductase (H+-translocating)